jgi:hypothetical protein
MQITAESFQQMVGELTSLAPGPSAEDRRRSRRTALDLSATLMPFSEQIAKENLEVPIRDLSRGGFAFLHDRRLPLGEQFALLLHESSGKPLAILCTIAWWQPLDDGFYAIGAKFCRLLRKNNANLPLLLEDVTEPNQSARAVS